MLILGRCPNPRRYGLLSHKAVRRPPLAPMALSVAEKGICLENLSHPRLLEGGTRREAVGGVERSETVFQAYTLRSEAAVGFHQPLRNWAGVNPV